MPSIKIGFLTLTIFDLIDIILVTWIFYKVYQYFRETRAGQMLIGLIILLISSFIFGDIAYKFRRRNLVCLNVQLFNSDEIMTITVRQRNNSLSALGLRSVGEIHALVYALAC